ncbi:hypothetical protein [Paenibacillus sp. PCH8]|uniref:hypothetical protein n=1 Tax=Paenibacillus sp. PCH8 TaxID=2066524 RepID=UPI0015E45013|nr:hypothetical protein [Paenibacillus sp. PCH8]
MVHFLEAVIPEVLMEVVQVVQAVIQVEDFTDIVSFSGEHWTYPSPSSDQVKKLLRQLLYHSIQHYFD